ncbi:hypothetical protein LUZ62_034541 [Rhynchospora pubera]|uniref:Uncharacterized protein n=1 Tax=Rhynchospora pubera TaxID=906938 RepID=A0AAV8ET03_9POAL|nr:hypothetical protein LUZ62_034541 [Rhynchospora pubera]
MAFHQQKRRRTGKAVTPSPSFSYQQKKLPQLEWQYWSDELNEWLDKTQERGLHSSRNRRMVNPPTWEPSPNIVVPLMSHQKEWLYWALNQEGSDIKGGILADDMGMGKTIEAISLVLTSRDLHLRSGASSSTSPVTLKTTLVICPMAALMQWVSEITKCTRTGTAKVFVYHGPHREEGNVDFRKYDFVLTTYRTVKDDYTNHIMPPKRICNYCRRSFGSDRELQSHQRNKCVLFASKTKKAEHKRRKQRPAPDGMSLLHLVRWKRIILDEAHYIKNRQTVSAKAVCSLDSEYKWAISGTPLQNKLGDFYSLIRFLRVFPYSYYFCKNCDCRELDYGRLHDLSDTLDERESCFYSALEAAIRSEYNLYACLSLKDSKPVVLYAADHPNLIIYSKKPELPNGIIEDYRAEIGNMMERDASMKGIVFSQFVDFLDLIEFSLSQSGIKTEKYIGGMSKEKRLKVIETFITDANCKILLVSLMAGGVALNLTAASHVFLMDPWWNPAVDKQAQDRVHRIGQHEDVRYS